MNDHNTRTKPRQCRSWHAPTHLVCTGVENFAGSLVWSRATATPCGILLMLPSPPPTSHLQQQTSGAWLFYTCPQPALDLYSSLTLHFPFWVVIRLASPTLPCFLPNNWFLFNSSWPPPPPPLLAGWIHTPGSMLCIGYLLLASLSCFLFQERADQRSEQVGTGARSERIRTYNFAQVATALGGTPAGVLVSQDRITDHRVGLSITNMDKMLAGEKYQLGQLVDALAEAERQDLLQEFSEEWILRRWSSKDGSEARYCQSRFMSIGTSVTCYWNRSCLWFDFHHSIQSFLLSYFWKLWSEAGTDLYYVAFAS